MQSTLYIRLGNSPEGEVQWLSRNEQGASTTRSGDFKELALRAQGQRLCVLVPAISLLALKASLPPLQGQKLRRAIPYAVEELLAEDVESYHFAIGKRDSEGQVPLFAVNQAQMAAWLQRFSEVELKPHQFLNEAQLLPWSEGCASILLEPDGALLKLSAIETYAFPLAELEMMLKLAQQQYGDSLTSLNIFDARGESAAQLQWQTDEIASLEQSYQTVADPLVLLSSEIGSEAIDLLQGEFSRKEQIGRLWRPWRATAALLGGWLLLLGGESVVDYQRLVAEEQRLYEAVETSYRDAFPEAKNIVNPRVQMERKLAELQGGGGGGAFVSLLATGAPVLNSAKGARIESLRYRQGELEVEMLLQDLPALDGLKQALQQEGISVEIRNATSRNDQVEARVSLRGEGQ